LKSGKRDTLWSYAGFGNYSIKQVLKTKVLGCADSSVFKVDVNSIPKAVIVASDPMVCDIDAFSRFCQPIHQCRWETHEF